ncbi:MAG: addiction module protein [Gammaproteobacteria bacterium]|nr:addiction module protein [Gammaproteobacteria bacterium]
MGTSSAEIETAWAEEIEERVAAFDRGEHKPMLRKTFLRKRDWRRRRPRSITGVPSD